MNIPILERPIHSIVAKGSTLLNMVAKWMETRGLVNGFHNKKGGQGVRGQILPDLPEGGHRLAAKVRHRAPSAG